jgi:hypothetical protein
MQSRTKTHVLRALGGLIAVTAVVPWLGGTSAQAASPNDGSCATRPSGVSGTATCTLLLGPNGKMVYGETWVDRTSANVLKVKTFPESASEGVTLCLTKSGAYSLKHQCNAGDSDNAYAGSSTSLSIALDGVGISASDPVYYSLSVAQASTMANSNGKGGATPSPSPSASPTKSPTKSPSKSPTPTPTPTKTSTSPSASPTKTSTSPSASPTKTSTSPSASPTKTSTSPSASPTKTSTSPSASPTKTSTSPSASPTKTSTSPSASVSATQSQKSDAASPATSVLGVKLAHTGADGTANALALSVGLLAVGGILIAAGQNNRPKRRH